MSWLYSQALVEAFSEASCSDGAQSAPLKSTPTPQAYLWRDKTTDAWSRFPSGMTCEPLTEGHGGGLLTWFLAGFPVRTFQAQAKGPELRAQNQGSGKKWPASLARYDHYLHLWKTHQYSLHGGLESYSETWPRWGTMRAGECWEQSIPAHLTDETGSGLWPTPVADGDRTTNYAQGGTSLGFAVRIWPTPTSNDAVGADYQRANGNHYFTLVGAVGATKHLPPEMEEKRVKIWPTPRAQDSYERSNWKTIVAANENGTAQMTLTRKVKYASRMWPTVTARDWKGANTEQGLTRKDGKSRMDQLANAVAWPTPCAGDYRSPNLNPCKNGQKIEPASGHALPAQVGGQLNPTWVEWLMSWPIGWTDIQHDCTYQTEYWKEASAADVSGNRLLEMWFNKEAGAPPQRLREFKLQQDSRPEISRVAVGVMNRVDRLKAIGNGQVPAVAALAWGMLTTWVKKT